MVLIISFIGNQRSTIAFMLNLIHQFQWFQDRTGCFSAYNQIYSLIICFNLMFFTSPNLILSVFNVDSYLVKRDPNNFNQLPSYSFFMTGTCYIHITQGMAFISTCKLGECFAIYGLIFSFLREFFLSLVCSPH